MSTMRTHRPVNIDVHEILKTAALQPAARCKPLVLLEAASYQPVGVPISGAQHVVGPSVIQELRPINGWPLSIAHGALGIGISRRRSISVVACEEGWPTVDELDPKSTSDPTTSTIVVVHGPIEGAPPETIPVDLRGLERFMARVRHELGNPINAVGNTLRLLSRHHDKYDEEKTAQYISRALAEIEQASHLLDQLARLSQLNKIRAREVDLSVFSRQVEPALQTEAHEEDVELTIRVEPADVSAIIDPRALRLVLQELVSNAIEACAGQDDRRVDMLLTKQGHELICRVTDSGKGLDEGSRMILFEPLHSTKPDHAGVGLLVVLKAITRMKGRLEVELAEGCGATFTFRLPAAPL